MDLLSDIHERFHSIGSNADTIWVRLFGYHRAAENTIHVIDDDIRKLQFETGFRCSNAPYLKHKHLMYRTMNNISIPIGSNSCYAVFDSDFPCRVRLLKFEDGKFHLYRYDVKENKFVPSEESVREWKLVCAWYRETRCTTEEMDFRFSQVNRRGLRYANSVVKRLPSCFLEDREVVAVNYVTRRNADSAVHINHWVKVAVITPLTYHIYKFLYFDEHKPQRKAILDWMDPGKTHIQRVPRGLIFNLTFAAWIAANIMSC